MTIITRELLAERVHLIHNNKRRKAKNLQYVDQLVNALIDAIVEGNDVRIRGLGSFLLKLKMPEWVGIQQLVSCIL